MSELEIKIAIENDTQEASSILNEAESWLAERGMPLWPKDMLTPETISSAVARGEVYLVYRDGHSVATFMLQDDDPECWPDVTQGESTVFHRLAIRRCAAGTGLPAAILAWCAGKARLEGKKYLRLDCMADRPKLRNLYESLGFKFHSEWPIYWFVVARYEMDLANS